LIKEQFENKTGKYRERLQNMKAKGYPVSDIVEITGLSLAQVKRLS